MTYFRKSLITFTQLFLFLCLNTNCATAPKPQLTAEELADRYVQDGLYREALDQYSIALKKDPNNYTARLNTGVVMIRLGDYKRAITNIKKSAPAFKDSFEYNYYLAEALRAQEEYGSAIYHYRKALSLRDSDAKSLKALAWSYFRIRYYKEAELHAKHLIKVTPTDTQSLLILARIQTKTHDLKSAMRSLKKARKVANKKEKATLDSAEGDVWLAANKFSKAAKVYKSALKEEPLLAGAALGLGRCHLAAGKTESAISYFERAIRVRPSMSEALYYLAKAHLPKAPIKASKYLKRFVSKATDDPELIAKVDEARNTLKSLK